jgi:hypothetical protein
MGATLSTINILSQIASNQLNTDVEKSRGMLNIINTSAQKMLDNMDYIVWSINPANDKIDKVAVEVAWNDLVPLSVKWFTEPVPESSQSFTARLLITILSVLEGTDNELQFEAVFQSVLVPPIQ